MQCIYVSYMEMYHGNATTTARLLWVTLVEFVVIIYVLQRIVYKGRSYTTGVLLTLAYNVLYVPH